MSKIPATALPSLIDWPRDEAAHDGPPWEIWWITARLKARDRSLAVHAMFYRLASGPLSVGVTITDLDRGEELTRELLAQPGEASVSKAELRVESALCSFSGSYEEGYALTATLDDGNGFDLRLAATRPVLHNGGSGQYVFQGVQTTQYSIGHLQTAGRVRLAGEDLEVLGDGWYDRQWDHWQRKGALAFTWFGVCLDNGDTLSVFDTTAGEPGHRWATIARPDGAHLVAGVEIAPSEPYPTGVGRIVPRAWTLTVPHLNARLQIEQRLVADKRQLYTGALEVRGDYEGQAVSGYGFCDIAGPNA
jgi:predicted secreted hydrolase